jgi:hypothetical protein
MSATLKCDLCGQHIDGKNLTTPRLYRHGDIEPARQDTVAIGTGFAVIGASTPVYPDPVKADEELLLEQRRKGTVPGYPIVMRTDRELVRLWVTWREKEDICKRCVEKAIRKKADEILRNDPLGALAEIE